MKVRWIGEPRELADPQIEVSAGDELDLDTQVAKSLIDQGLAEKIGAAAPKRQRRRKPAVSAETSAPRADVTEETE